MNNSEKILKTLSSLIENGILTSKDIKKEISTDFKFKKDKLIKNFFYIRANDLKIELIFRLPPIINYYRLEPLYVRAPYVG